MMTMLRSALLALSGFALTACGGDDAAWTALSDNAASCGFEMQDRVEWGEAVASSGLQMQEARAEPGLVLRVWSEADANVAGTVDTLTARAQGPAWVAADVRPETYMLYLPDSAVDLRVTAAGAECAPAGAGE